MYADAIRFLRILGDGDGRPVPVQE